MFQPACRFFFTSVTPRPWMPPIHLRPLLQGTQESSRLHPKVDSIACSLTKASEMAAGFSSFSATYPTLEKRKTIFKSGWVMLAPGSFFKPFDLPATPGQATISSPSKALASLVLDFARRKWLRPSPQMPRFSTYLSHVSNFEEIIQYLNLQMNLLIADPKMWQPFPIHLNMLNF